MLPPTGDTACSAPTVDQMLTVLSSRPLTPKQDKGKNIFFALSILGVYG